MKSPALVQQEPPVKAPIIAGTTLIFAAFGLMASIPEMEIHWGWAVRVGGVLNKNDSKHGTAERFDLLGSIYGYHGSA